ncbi:MAG TPA: cyclic nucleotide-binding domain-containing protein, partial [Elusimicrobiota bacterium]|nr:cyclic nucleotide-binding domain-containing protein [Elusimicrobiota bacterium]
MTVTEFLKDNVPFLQGLTEEQAGALARAAEQLPFKKGQTVIFQGSTVDGLHVVASGQVSVMIRPDKGRKEMLQVALLGPGDVFGESSIVEFTTAAATIKSAADDTLVFMIPESVFTSLLESDEALRERTLALIAARRKGRQDANT